MKQIVFNPDYLDSRHGGHNDASHSIITFQGSRIVARMAFLLHLNHVIFPSSQIPDISWRRGNGVIDSCDLQRHSAPGFIVQLYPRCRQRWVYMLKQAVLNDSSCSREILQLRENSALYSVVLKKVECSSTTGTWGSSRCVHCSVLCVGTSIKTHPATPSRSHKCCSCRIEILHEKFCQEPPGHDRG